MIHYTSTITLSRSETILKTTQTPSLENEYLCRHALLGYTIRYYHNKHKFLSSLTRTQSTLVSRS